MKIDIEELARVYKDAYGKIVIFKKKGKKARLINPTEVIVFNYK